MVSDDTFRDASETSHECLMIFFIRIRTKVGFTIAGDIVVIQYFISFIKGEEVTAKREKVRCNSDHYFLFSLQTTTFLQWGISTKVNYKQRMASKHLSLSLHGILVF